LQRPKRQTVDHDLCDRFIEILKDTGLTYMEFANRMGLSSKSSLNEIKRYVTQPSINQIRALYYEFGVSSDWLLYGIGNKYIARRVAADPLFEIESGLKRLELEVKRLKRRGQTRPQRD
jgi:transcriptional regulator with XRE-family HTH domain